MGVLSKILSTKREELPRLRSQKLPTRPPSTPRLVLDNAADADLRLIAEIKRRSPSAGPLSRTLSVSERAKAYETAGAWMISVLCDETYFDGSYEHLLEARQSTNLPLLCKEFILDECQLDAAAAYGASSALLIVRCLPRARLAPLIAAAVDRGLAPLVEVFTQEEADLALDAGAGFIGVNSRDLDTLKMNVERASSIVASIPDNVFVAQLSGVKTPEEVSALAGSRANAALIGEVLMRQDDPTAVLTELVLAGRRSG